MLTHGGDGSGVGEEAPGPDRGEAAAVEDAGSEAHHLLEALLDAPHPAALLEDHLAEEVVLPEGEGGDEVGPAEGTRRAVTGCWDPPMPGSGGSTHHPPVLQGHADEALAVLQDERGDAGAAGERLSRAADDDGHRVARAVLRQQVPDGAARHRAQPCGGTDQRCGGTARDPAGGDPPKDHPRTA